ncbi:MAG: hypothetical protein R3C30_00235 [Hyphomonadaceae bacterium]
MHDEALNDFARDFSFAIGSASQDLAEEKREELNALLLSFEQLFIDMQRLRRDIHRSLSENVPAKA